ncbi:nuclear transport factor 2 family protein [Streptomyces boncukensis]|uniref:SnoaL-like domain-containing protein n=1 Tax=Streptomyces boncukensis TaxID=2711219 RepID=A0A6G4X3P4_9ACTN|nr:nuclear transport factor 2 family protein [Streptomyces boncukensis]NGO72159.1 SnoaL-like domain-containing protein [Streptomyces boncukensis]
MPDEETRKRLTREYARRISEGDIEGVIGMFADDIVFEDPVGAPPLRGKEQLRRRIAEAVACQVHETPGRAVTSMDERYVVVPSTVVVHVPTKLTFHVIGIMEIGEDGLSRHVRAFWGISDTQVGDGPQESGVRHFATVAEHLTEMAKQAGPERSAR